MRGLQNILCLQVNFFGVQVRMAWVLLHVLQFPPRTIAFPPRRHVLGDLQIRQCDPDGWLKWLRDIQCDRGGGGGEISTGALFFLKGGVSTRFRPSPTQ